MLSLGKRDDLRNAIQQNLMLTDRRMGKKLWQMHIVEFYIEVKMNGQDLHVLHE